MNSVTIDPTKSRAPFFSVCLPTYNRAPYLATAIRSVLDQDFQDFELLICDNASTDNTRVVIESFSNSRIRAVYWPELVSMYANHNRCVEDARGQWTVFLHSDDSFPPGYLSRLFAEAKEAAAADIICNPFNPQDHALALKWGDNDPLTVMAFTILEGGQTPSGTAYKTESFARYGRFLDNTMFADAALLVTWAGQGASLRLFKFSPNVWALSSESELANMRLQPDYCLNDIPLLDAAYRGPRAAEFRRYLLNNVPLLPAKLQSRMILKHYQCGYPRDAEAIWNAVGGGRSLCGQRSFYVHVLPLRYATRLYWPVILNCRKIKYAFLKRARKRRAALPARSRNGDG